MAGLISSLLHWSLVLRSKLLITPLTLSEYALWEPLQWTHLAMLTVDTIFTCYRLTEYLHKPQGTVPSFPSLTLQGTIGTTCKKKGQPHIQN